MFIKIKNFLQCSFKINRNKNVELGFNEEIKSFKSLENSKVMSLEMEYDYRKAKIIIKGSIGVQALHCVVNINLI